MSTLTAPRRVTVVAPQARVDVALPVQTTVAELLPQLVRMAAANGQAPAIGYGWELGRLGAPPLDAASTVAGAGIRDGEVLYLNRLNRYVDPVLFDDVVDAIADTTALRPGTWRPGISRRLGLGTVVLALASVAVLVAVTSPWPWASAILGGLAALLLIAGGALARAYGDATAGAVAAAAGLPAVMLSGLTAMNPGRLVVDSGELALASTAVTVYAVLAAVLVSDRIAWFTGVAVVATAGALAAAATIVTGAGTSTVAAVVVTLAALLGPVVPMLALRAGRLPLPRVPSDAAGFRRDVRPTLGPEVAGGTTTATNVLTGLLAALATIVLGGALGLLTASAGWAWALAGLGGLALVLRARAYVGIGQRGALLLCGAGVLAGTGGRLAVTGGEPVRLALIAAALLVAVVCTSYAVPAHTVSSSPYWTRLLDVVEFFALASLVPVAAAVMGVYAAIRAWGG